MSTPTLQGIIAYPVTPFTAEDTVDLNVLSQLIDQLIDSGADAIAALGSAGEAAYLDAEEWQQVAEHTIQQVGGRVPVVIGIAELTTKTAIDRARFAQLAGADVVMISPLAYYSLTEQEIRQHFTSIAEAIDIPIMLYNNPATCGVDMSPQLMLSLVEQISNITMIKESSGDIQRMHQIWSLSGGSVPFYNGCNYLALEALNAGVSGWCTAAPGLIGDQPKQLVNAVQSGDLSTARHLFYAQRELLTFIVKNGLASSVKAGLRMNGLNAGTARKPLLELPTPAQATLKQLLDNLSA